MTNKKTLSLSISEIRKSGSVSEKNLAELEVRLIEAKLQAEVDNWYRKKHSKRYKGY